MAKPTSISMILSAADDDGITLSYNPANNATLNIDGAFATAGVATLDYPRRVVITSASDDRAVNFTITGTDRYGRVVSEVLAGGNATAAVSVRDYKTITSIVASGNPGVVIVGTNTKGSSAWVPVNHRAENFALAIGVKLSVAASLNYEIEHTFDDVQDADVAYGTGIITPYSHATLTSKTSNADGNYIAPPRAWRLTINTWVGGTATATGIQAGL